MNIINNPKFEIDRVRAGVARLVEHCVNTVKIFAQLRGKLDRQSSTRVYPVKLAAGKNYVIDMVSPDQKTLDPYLVLTDGTGKSLAEDDDSGGGLNARIIFRPEQAGTFRILATSINFGAGAFTLTVRETANAPQKTKQ